MKILLVSAPHADTFGYSMPPPGLLRLGGALRDAGHQPALEDLAHRLATGAIAGGEELAVSAAKYLLPRGQPDLFGLSVMGATLPIALEIARELRPLWPGVPFVLGGPGVNGTDHWILERFPWIDGIVRGEGEVTVVQMADALRRRDTPFEVDGVTYRGPDGTPKRTPDRAMIQDLGTLPRYAWDLLPTITEYKAVTGEEDGLVPLDSGRGCVYDCSFCSIGRTWSRRSRPLPPERLVQEIAELRGIPGARRAYLCHDIFGADRKHAMAFTERMIAEQIQIPWEVRARADHLDAELLLAMGRAGCDRVLLGIESASPSVRARNQKGMAETIDLLGVVDDCAAAGITPILSLILGLPGETDAELDESLTFCAAAALRAGVNLSLHLVNPQPGCALGEEFAAVSRPVEGIPPDMALGAGLSARERALIEAHPDLFSTWSLLPYEEDRLRELTFLSLDFPKVLMRFPRTFAQLMADGSCGALELARAWRRDGRTFETFARERAAADRSCSVETPAIIDELLAWETALVRVGARGARRAVPGRYRLNAELFTSKLPLTEWTAHLSRCLDERAGRRVEAASAPSPIAAPDAPQTYAVAAPVSAPGRLGGVRTLRLGSGVTRLIDAVVAPEASQDALEAMLSSDKAQHAVRNLVQSGVLSYTVPGDTISR
ncbi:B12-binding domain-containing radical SAM protein [Planctomycetes bacterium Poly30]|uniref:B12-binding domain-containing radical SAM protein n=1 Tax=Saltatorellus ferox TaxID=2528018 RepID=UPI00119FF3E7